MTRQCFKTEVISASSASRNKRGPMTKAEKARYPDENFLLAQRGPNQSLVKFEIKAEEGLAQVYWWHLRRSKIIEKITA